MREQEGSPADAPLNARFPDKAHSWYAKVECVQCGAPPGRACVTTTSGKTSKPHEARKRGAEAAGHKPGTAL